MSEPRTAPYPADTRAKGWRFELDYEQIEQSDTWSLAAEIPMCQHALLMMWMVAWAQTPCGSFPNDEGVIRAKCKVPPAVWGKCRDALMRGWWLADDGRMYHPTITALVFEMMAKRRKESDRKALARARTDTGVQPMSHGTDTGQTPDSTRNPTPTTDHLSSSPTSKKTARAAPSPVDRPADVDEDVWRDWLALRKAKKAPVSPTVLAGAVAEAAKAGMSLEAFLRVWCTRGTQGLLAEWLKPHERPQQPSAAIREPAWRAEQRQRTADFAGPYAAKATTAQPPHEEHHGLAISVD